MRSTSIIEGKVDQSVVAMASGTVIASDLTEENRGNERGTFHYVWVQASDGLIIQYTHLDGKSIFFKYGDKIAQGQLMGNYGLYGSDTNYEHLHISFLRLFSNPEDRKGKSCYESGYCYIHPKDEWPGGQPRNWTGFGSAGPGDE